MRNNMNILWISPECPYPANSGGRIGIWKRIEYFSKYDNIYFLAIADSKTDYTFITEMRKYCKEVYLFSRDNSFKKYIRSLYFPFTAVSRWPKKMTQQIEEICENNSIDLIMIDSPQMVGCIPEKILVKYKVVLNQHNCEYKLLHSLSFAQKSVLKKLAYRAVAKQMKQYEKRLYKKGNIDLYTFVSELDMEEFTKEYKLCNTVLVPVGTDVNINPILSNCHNMLFCAQMSYPANEQAALWLMRNTWDSIEVVIPDARLYLVGKKPGEIILHEAKKHKGVIVTGTVDSVEEYYEKANLVAMPIEHGGGVKVKLIEALGRGKIVLTTEKGKEGTTLKDKKEILIYNGVNDFVEKCISILNNPEDYETIRNNAVKSIEEKYSWKSILTTFRGKVLELLALNNNSG